MYTTLKPMNDANARALNRLRVLTTTVFVVVVAWWVILRLYSNTTDFENLMWAASYQLVALLGAIGGLVASRFWGGFRSFFGKTVTFFSLGLLLQVFGQSAFSFYNLVLKVDVPYPSIADVGFVGSIFFYILGAWYLARVVAIKSSLNMFSNRMVALLVPLAMLFISYYFFLNGYVFDWQQPLKIFIDLGDPLGDVMYISLTLTTLLLSRDFLGGLMKKPVLVVLAALVVQYVADFNFLYQASQGTWVNGGYGDLLYATSYFIMALSLLGLGMIFKKIKET